MHRPLSCLVVVPPLAVALVAVVLGGCGSKDDGVDKARVKAPAAEVLKEAQTALAIQKTLHVEGRSRSRAGVTTSVVADVAAAGGGAMKLSVKTGAAIADVIVSGGKGYVRGNKPFWGAGHGDQAADALAAKLAGNWTTEPSDSDFEGQMKKLLPGRLSSCLAVGHGPLVNLGAQKDAGTDVVVLRDAGGRPGTAPGELSIAAGGPALPLRLRQTGPLRAGGTLDPRCFSDEDRRTVATDYRFSKFGESVTVAAPPKPLDYEKVLGDVVADIL